MKKFIRIGVDLGKRYFQVHALESEDGRATTRKLCRSAMQKFFSEIEPCVVGMEACGSAHYCETVRSKAYQLELMQFGWCHSFCKRGVKLPSKGL